MFEDRFSDRTWQVIFFLNVRYDHRSLNAAAAGRSFEPACPLHLKLNGMEEKKEIREGFIIRCTVAVCSLSLIFLPPVLRLIETNDCLEALGKKKRITPRSCTRTKSTVWVNLKCDLIFTSIIPFLKKKLFFIDEVSGVLLLFCVCVR